MEQYNIASGCWVCWKCLSINFSQARECIATHCAGFNHHVRSQQIHERNLKKIKYKLLKNLPLAAHFARFIGLECIDEVSRSYGDDGIRLAQTIDPSTSPGAQPFPEQTLQPIVVYKGDFQNIYKVSGRPTLDAR